MAGGGGEICVTFQHAGVRGGCSDCMTCPPHAPNCSDARSRPCMPQPALMHDPPPSSPHLLSYMTCPLISRTFLHCVALWNTFWLPRRLLCCPDPFIPSPPPSRGPPPSSPFALHPPPQCVALWNKFWAAYWRIKCLGQICLRCTLHPLRLLSHRPTPFVPVRPPTTPSVLRCGTSSGLPTGACPPTTTSATS